MNYAELIEQVAAETEMTKADVKRTLDAQKSVIHKALSKGKLEDRAVSLPGIGKLTVAKRAAREGRNPQTGEPIKIPARKAPKFSPSKELKDVVL